MEESPNLTRMISRYGLRRKAAAKDDKQAAVAASLGTEDSADRSEEEEQRISALLGSMTQASEVRMSGCCAFPRVVSSCGLTAGRGG